MRKDKRKRDQGARAARVDSLAGYVLAVDYIYISGNAPPEYRTIEIRNAPAIIRKLIDKE